MSDEAQSEQSSIVDRLKKVGLDISKVPEVSYVDLRLDMLKYCGVFEGAFGKEGGNELWEAFNKKRMNFYDGERWAQSVAKKGGYSLLHAVPECNRFDIIDITENGEINISRFVNSQWRWTIEDADKSDKFYTSNKGVAIEHEENEQYKIKRVFHPRSNLGVFEHTTVYNKETKQKDVFHKLDAYGRTYNCDAQENIIEDLTVRDASYFSEGLKDICYAQLRAKENERITSLREKIKSREPGDISQKTSINRGKIASLSPALQKVLKKKRAHNL